MCLKRTASAVQRCQNQRKRCSYGRDRVGASQVSTQDTTFLMFADTEKEKDDWIGAIGRAIVRCSTTYTNDDGMEDDSEDDDA